MRGGAVGTLMSNMGLELALKQLGIPFARAKVGDRYVLEKLQEKAGALARRTPATSFCWTKPQPAMALSQACRLWRQWCVII
jgi:phosphomannomutase